MIGPSIRILGMINRVQPVVKTYCQLWFENQKEPVFIKTWEYKLVWYKKWGNQQQGIYQPYLIACQMPLKYHKKVNMEKVTSRVHGCSLTRQERASQLGIDFQKHIIVNPRGLLMILIRYIRD